MKIKENFNKFLKNSLITNFNTTFFHFLNKKYKNFHKFLKYI